MGKGLVTSLAQDFRYCWRRIQKSPVFTAVAVMVLGLGIGANVAMFGTLNSALLRPLPFSEPDRLVMGRATSDGALNPWAAAPDDYDCRDQARSFDNLAAILPFVMDYTVTGSEQPERVGGTAVSVNLFATLGVPPQLGRPFSAEEGTAGAPDVAVISHGYWQRHFAGLPDAVGQTLTIDGNPFTVVGVMPSGFRFLSDVDFWRPMRPDRDAASLRDRHNWLLVGRLRDDASAAQAQQEVDVISSQLAASYPETNDGKALVLTDLHEVLVGDYTTRLYVLMGAVALVFLIACGNVTGMLLARAPARRLELSLRAALGASRVRLVRQLIIESLVLAVAAGVFGTILAAWLQQVIFAFLSMELPGIESAGISPLVLLFAVGLSIAAGLLAGVYPAITSARANLAQDLKVGARTAIGAGTQFRNGLIVAQVAVSVVLLIGSTLLIRSLDNVRAVDPGFEPANVLTAEIELPREGYPERDARIQFFTELVDAVRAIPGVGSAGVINALPIREPRNVFHAYPARDPDQDRSVFLRSVMPGYFRTMRVPVVAGRDVERTDAGDAPGVVVISERLAETFFPNQDPLGEVLTLDYFDEPRTVEVVGVVGDVRVSGLDASPGLTMYVPYYQTPYFAMRLAVRTTSEPATALSAVRDAVWRLDGDIPVAGVTTMQRVVTNSVSDRKTVAVSLLLYAVLPLIMAAIGLYAVLSYYVTQRFREIGIHMALGASGTDVTKMILRRGIGLVTLGIAVGIVGALGATRLIQQMLFGVGPTDVATFVVISILVASVAVVASLVPTWRAVRVNPSVALQAE